MTWTGQFFKGVFSESDGTPSFGRVQTFIHGVFGCGWVTSFVMHNHFALPDSITLAGILAFIMGPYGTNKVATAWKESKQPQQPQAPGATS